MLKEFALVVLSVTIMASGVSLAISAGAGETHQTQPPPQLEAHQPTPPPQTSQLEGIQPLTQSANTSQPENTSPVNGSVQQLKRFAQSSGISEAISGTKVNLRLTLENGSTVLWGLKFAGKPTVTRGGFSDPVVEIQTSSRTVQSIVESNASWQATKKALSYELIKIKGEGTGTEFLAGTGSFIASQVNGPQTKSTSVDPDNDGRKDAILDIEGIDTDDDPGFEKQINTVIRDIDNDSEMETVSSNIVDVNPSLAGVARIDTDDDGIEDAILRVEGTDTNGDLKFDKRTKIRLADTNGDKQVDSFSETTDPIQSAEIAVGKWDLNDDNVSDVKVEVDGEDTNNDGKFDKKTTTVHLNKDGVEGYDTKSTKTASVNPSLSMSAKFDTDGDGAADTKIRYTASDSDGNGVFDNEKITQLKDTNGDGAMDQALSLVECKRGFIRQSVCHEGLIGGSGGIVTFLAAPANLSRIGSMASIVGTLVQLGRGE